MSEEPQPSDHTPDPDVMVRRRAVTSAEVREPVVRRPEAQEEQEPEPREGLKRRPDPTPQSEPSPVEGVKRQRTEPREQASERIVRERASGPAAPTQDRYGNPIAARAAHPEV